MKKILVILGPTGTGKTDLALRLALLAQGELVSADSRQVYKGLDIGTGKMPNKLKIENLKLKIKRGNGYWEIDGINIWMYDVADPKDQYNVARFVSQANKVIKNINIRGKLPILVGGTGLYIKALTEGLSNLSLPVNLSLRKKLNEFSKEDMQISLKKISPERWKKMNYSDRQNPRRLIRAIELSSVQKIKLTWPNYETLKIGLTAPREVLYKRVDERVVERINQGMIEEAKRLHKKGLSLKRMKQLGLEYGVLAKFLSGEIREIKGDKGLIKIMQGEIHGFVRRQLTWFKREKDINWFDITQGNFATKVEKLVNGWYHQAHATEN
ncbi:MAG: tRNA dimethylallyltransferase [Microgenomates group bacterium Gr01-1014_7]|nr:MAG: tRNA dimethylallyltransferase [Microgenomates group bacterium Gr01-1014_7]